MRNFRHGRLALVVTCAAAVATTATVLPSAASTPTHLAGTSRPKVPKALTVSFVGHGYGAGIGMGQWGDFGYAVRYHFGYERILNHFYGGTTAASLTSLGSSANPTISVVLMENLNLTTNVGYDPVVTSPSAYSLASAPVTTTPTTTTTTTTTTTLVPTPTGVSGVIGNTGVVGVSGLSGVTGNTGTTGMVALGALSVPGGTAVDLRLQPNGTWNAYEGTSCATAQTAANSAIPVATGLTNPVVTPASTSPTATSATLLSVCRHDGVDETLRGQVQAYDRSGYERTLNLVPLQSYLDGVVPAEESASWGKDGSSMGSPQSEPWGFQALEAQAVAARSYEMAYAASGGWNGYADICDNTECQAYVGANFEYPISTLAVNDTTGEVRTVANPKSPTPSIVSTRYSASTGGYTAPSSFPSVPDLGDACVVKTVALECNPNHTWRATVSATTIDKAYKTIGTLVRIRVTARTGHGSLGGRALKVSVVGSKATVSVAAIDFATALGLKSDWYAIAKIVDSGTVATTTTTIPTTGANGVTGVNGATGVTGATGVSGATGI